ncbi:MAG: hypothetical protein Ct9H90mP19_0740 [Gammaproteobacteria bacterium]|nr:MAG: hypothetical protein Ct9H90mP19_0740 [Gammaproteobacteria bacterium]
MSFPDIAFQGIRKDCIGEIIVSIDVIKKEVLGPTKTKLTSNTLNNTFHVALLGYKHDVENDAILMERKEIEFLSKIGIPNPYK